MSNVFFKTPLSECIFRFKVCYLYRYRGGVNTLSNFKNFIKNALFFNEPQKTEHFILTESQDASPSEEQNAEDTANTKPDAKKRSRRLPRKTQAQPPLTQNENAPLAISKRLSENLDYMKTKYSLPVNGDIVLREFDIIVKHKVISAFIMFHDGMVERKIINQTILQPLMLLSNLDIKSTEEDIVSYISKHILPQNQLIITQEYTEVINMVNFGGCVIFLDGINTAFVADVKGWEHRNVQRPNTELVIRGPQEGFTEILRVNTALIRKILRDENLIAENISIGRRSHTPCAMLYIKDITNNALVQEVRKRLESIRIDYITDSGELEQLIEDNVFLPAPQILATERPDRVAAMLAEGKVAVIMSGSPFALVMPVTFFALIHSPEDSYVRFTYANLLRFIRILAILFSLLLPGLYVAITNFHHELIPTDLLLAIAASREKVPFPSIVEILIMEISFELIREAGIRIPGPIGPTLGIIGALILGQAAVAANIVSPILIVIVAVTGIGSFAIPNFSMGFAFRILRFVYIGLGGMVGFLGIAVGLFIHGLVLTGAKSFGVPFLAPFGPKTSGGLTDEITRAPIWKQEKRPDFLNPKHKKEQPNISKGWMNKK